MAHTRSFRKLRLSLLDACQFRCIYCMPEHPQFMSAHELLSPAQIEHMVRGLISCGVEEIRLTGGEPLLRSEVVNIVSRLSVLGLKRLGLTTNGKKLSELAHDLKRAGLQNVNISLDSLNAKTFHKISRRDVLHKVIAGLEAAMSAGLEVKVNVVVMRGMNDHELADFVEFSKKYQIEVRFLECMKIGVMKNRFDEHHVPAREMIARLEKNYNLKTVPVDRDSIAFKYKIDERALIGMIASESMPFCGDCSRLRLDAKGILRACMMHEHGVSLKNLDYGDYAPLLARLMATKPMDRIESVDREMFQIGG